MSAKSLNKKDLFFALFGLFCLFLAISIYSFHPQDPGIGVCGAERVHNLCGLIGAYLSSLFFFLFGISALLVPPFVFFSLFLSYTGFSVKKILCIFFLILFSFSFTFAYLFQILKVKNFYLFKKYPLNGGLIGELSGIIISLIGVPGFFLFVMALLIIALFIAFGGMDFVKKYFKKEEKSKDKRAETKEITYESNKDEESEGMSEETDVFIPVNFPRSGEGKVIDVEEELPEGVLELSKEKEVKKIKLPPPLELLSAPPATSYRVREEELRERALLLISKLEEFGIRGEVVGISPGPVITVFEFKPAPGIKISRILSLVDDLALGLSAKSVRIVAPIPGRDVIGIEISNPQREWVYLKEILASSLFQKAESPLTISLGKDISGNPVITDLRKMPHLLIAGSTGSGKSIFLHSVILSLVYKSSPEKIRFLMIDPKRIELSVYEDIPYLMHPVVLEPKTATKALKWLVSEMERRYALFEEVGARNLDSYNEKFEEKLPYIVMIIDELADLMVVSSKEVETYLARLAQMARAAGIHLLVATQRPSVDVITGLIKVNFPARISFQVTSKADSRTILDTQGAERLLGAGDMLFMPPGSSHLERIHAPYVSEQEVKKIVEYLKAYGKPEYLIDFTEFEEEEEEEFSSGESEDQEEDLYKEALKIAVQEGKISVSMLQRRLRIGYNRAARLVERMEKEGIIGPSDGVRPRPVINIPKSI
jgi:S-DNA-T family DNA segregation ATPase FtsK/SpoIIIE